MSLSTKKKPSTRERASLLRKVGRSLVPQIALRLLRDGEIDPTGKTDKEIRDEIADIILSEINRKDIKLTIGIDHTDMLLATARSSLRENKLDISALYYATYFEHRINWLISEICQKKKIGNTTIRQVLKEGNIRTKCTWVLELLGFPPVKKDILRSITLINEARNSFVHYKWPTNEADSEEYEELQKQQHANLKKAEIVVRHLRKIEEKALYSGHGKYIRRAMRAKPTAVSSKSGMDDAPTQRQ